MDVYGTHAPTLPVSLLTALATSDAPEGYARWSLRLLADKAVESGICDDVSYTFVRAVLKKTNSSPI